MDAFSGVHTVKEVGDSSPEGEQDADLLSSLV